MRDKKILEKYKKERIGQESINNQGCKMKIINYKNYNEVDIKFEDGTILHNINYGYFNNKSVRNNNFPSVYSIGYIGYGKYKSKVNNKNTKEYDIWHSMLRRCYDKKYQEKNPTYKDCTVCDEWLNFQNFAEWYNNNIWSEDCTCLDKDILIKGNKIYSSDTCILVIHKINTVFINRKSKRGKNYIGVYECKDCNGFTAHCSTFNEEYYLGFYKTELEAFYAYKTFKESYIKQVADEYKTKYSNFPQKLHNAMYNWEVEITD